MNEEKLLENRSEGRRTMSQCFLIETISLGYFAHVSTLEDIQENVEDYIPVTARPIAMFNDHVTVWSSVFLDVERTMPIKAYKWFAYKIPDLSISMEQFKNKSKVKLSIEQWKQLMNGFFFC